MIIRMRERLRALVGGRRNGPAPDEAGPRAARPGTGASGLGLLAVLLTGVVATIVSVPMAAVEGSLGPHRAQYEVTTDHVFKVDLGPLGSLTWESPLVWPLGVQVLVQEIPAGLSTAGETPEIALAGDLEGYIQFFTQPGLAVDEASRQLVMDAVTRVVLAWSVLLVLVGAARLASRRGALRVEIRAVLRRPGVAALVLVVAVAILAMPVRDWAARAPLAGRTSDVLAGTALADARIVGRLGDLIDTYGGAALAAIETNREFYDSAAANLAAAYESDPEARAPMGYAVAKTLPPGDPAVAEPGTDGTPANGGSGVGEAVVDGLAGPDPGDTDPNDAGASDVDATDAEASDPAGGAGTAPGDGAPVAAATAQPTAPIQAPGPTGEPEDFVTFLMVTDLHCNVGMSTVVGEAVRRSGAAAVLNAGDTVISGTSVEQFCVEALAQQVPRHVPVVVADGNHDSLLTSTQERSAGFTVLRGEPVTVRGVRILGDAEPNITTVTEGTRLRSGETRSEMALRLAERACRSQQEGDPIDILLVHNPRAGVTPMASGCVGLQLSGHFHRQVGPTHQGLGLLYAGGSTAGATEGKTSIGPLQSAGEMTVLRYDPVGHRPVDYRLITVLTDATVELGRWLPFPQRPVVPVTADLDLAEPEL